MRPALLRQGEPGMPEYVYGASLIGNGCNQFVAITTRTK